MRLHYNYAPLCATLVGTRTNVPNLVMEQVFIICFIGLYLPKFKKKGDLKTVEDSSECITKQLTGQGESGKGVSRLARFTSAIGSERVSGSCHC